MKLKDKKPVIAMLMWVLLNFKMIWSRICSIHIRLNQYQHAQVTTIVPYLAATNLLSLSVIKDSSSHPNGKRVAGSSASNTALTISPVQVDAKACQNQTVSSSMTLPLNIIEKNLHIVSSRVFALQYCFYLCSSLRFPSSNLTPIFGEY